MPDWPAEPVGVPLAAAEPLGWTGEPLVLLEGEAATGVPLLTGLPEVPVEAPVEGEPETAAEGASDGEAVTEATGVPEAVGVAATALPPATAPRTAVPTTETAMARRIFIGTSRFLKDGHAKRVQDLRAL
jgi:hypothetical protein